MVRWRLANLPEGVYTIGLNAFYRAGWNNEDVFNAWKDSIQSVNFFMYAETTEGKIIIPVKSIWEEARNADNDGLLGTGSETQVLDLYVPNDMTAAVAYFEEGRYKNEITIRVKDGKLRIGIFKDELVKEDWSMFDNWTLTYYGPNSKRANTETTGINATPSIKSEAKEAIYDLQGRQLPALQKGLNIVRRADGTTIKVFK